MNIKQHNYRISKTASQENPPLCLPRGDAKRRVRLDGGGESGASISQQFHQSYAPLVSQAHGGWHSNIPGDRAVSL